MRRKIVRISGGSRISRREGMDLIGGSVDSWGGYVSKILYVKTKELGPLGGMCAGRAPLDPPMQINWACDLSQTNFSLTFGPFQVLSAGSRGVPLSPVACFCSRNCLFCFKCDSCTSLYLEINSKVDFDAIKLCIFQKNWLFVHFFYRFLHLADSTV